MFKIVIFLDTLYSYWLARHILWKNTHLQDDSNKGLFSWYAKLHCDVMSHLSPLKGVPVSFLYHFYVYGQHTYFAFVILHSLIVVHPLSVCAKNKIAIRAFCIAVGCIWTSYLFFFLKEVFHILFATKLRRLWLIKCWIQMTMPTHDF